MHTRCQIQLIGPGVFKRNLWISSVCRYFIFLWSYLHLLILVLIKYKKNVRNYVYLINHFWQNLLLILQNMFLSSARSTPGVSGRLSFRPNSMHNVSSTFFSVYEPFFSRFSLQNRFIMKNFLAKGKENINLRRSKKSNTLLFFSFQ